MKHTYLYPLEDGELWLWRAARMGCSDLFGDPEPEADDAVWGAHARIAEEMGRAGEQLHKRLEFRDRICIGRHYAIPGSLCGTARERAWQADHMVRSVTETLWNAPHLDVSLYNKVFATVGQGAGRDGRDDLVTIKRFMDKHRDRRVVPVWM